MRKLAIARITGVSIGLIIAVVSIVISHFEGMGSTTDCGAILDSIKRMIE